MDKLKRVICIALSVVLFTGCGGRYLPPGEGETVSGGVVSGDAVSGGSVAEDVVSGSSVDGKESTESTGTGISGKFCTDTNLYFDDGFDFGVVQTRLDGTHAQTIELSEDYIYSIGVADGWLYYVIDESDAWFICRVPIQKEKGYDHVETDRTERLVELADLCNVLLVGNSLYYATSSGEDDVILERLDLKTGKKDSRRKIDEGWDCYLYEAGERVYAVTEDGLYTKRPNESDWTFLSDKCCGEEDIGEDIQACTEKACYYGRWEDSIMFDLRRIDAATGEDTLFASEKSICEAVRNSREFKGVKEFSCWIDSVYYDEGRIWILAQVNWMESGVYHMEYQVFSQGEEETGLRYEEELTGCMHAHSSVRTGKWVITEDAKETIVKEHVELNEGILYAVESGRAFMALYDGRKKKYRVGYCEIETGKFHWLTNRDPIFYEPVVSDRYLGENTWKFGFIYNDEPYRKNGFDSAVGIYDVMSYGSGDGEDSFFVETK